MRSDVIGGSFNIIGVEKGRYIEVFKILFSHKQLVLSFATIKYLQPIPALNALLIQHSREKGSSYLTVFFQAHNILPTFLPKEILSLIASYAMDDERTMELQARIIPKSLSGGIPPETQNPLTQFIFNGLSTAVSIGKQLFFSNLPKSQIDWVLLLKSQTALGKQLPNTSTAKQDVGNNDPVNIVARYLCK